MKRVIGITGGIASGKSNVCNVIKDMNYPVIDLDKITAELSVKGGPVYDAIVARFGTEYLTDDRELDKKKLGKLIFSNEAAKLVLNSVTHPLILAEMKDRIAACPDGLVFVEIPLLYESKLQNLCDKVICVFLNKKEQVERLMARDRIDEDFALKKIHSQMDLYMKKTLADYVVNSKGSFEETKLQVEKIVREIEGE